MNISPTQHATNAVAVAVPVGSWVAHLPETVTVVVGCLGAIYYLMLMFDWVVKKRHIWAQMHDSRGRVKAVITSDAHVPDPVEVLSGIDHHTS